MLVLTKASADRRALISAILIGSGIGLGLGAAYLAGGLARTATDHARASRLAKSAVGGFSEAALQGGAIDMDAGVLRVARSLDRGILASATERDRQTAVLTSRLARSGQSSDLNPQSLLLRASFAGPIAAPFQMVGPLATSRELECLTQAVYFEARGEGAAGQAAVAQVVLNRVRNPAFPKSVCGVVFQGAARGQGCQFSFACDGSMRRGREFAAWSRAEAVADRALSGTVMAAIGDATHFHTTSVRPGWGPNLLRVAQVGLHVFYRFGRSPSSSYAQIAPEMSAHPVENEPTDLVPELRLASAVVVQGPADAPEGLRGPMEAAAPVMAKSVDPVTSAPAAAPKAEPAKGGAATTS